MTELELHQQRRARWRQDGARPLRSVADAAEFMAEVGMCLMYPLHPPVLAPTFIGACAGTSEDLPTAQQAFRDPRAAQAKELMLRLLRSRQAYEAGFAGETSLLLSEETFPYFYALVGDRNPKRDIRELGEREKSSQLARDAYALIQQQGPLCKRRLAELLGGAPSEAALDRALGEMWARLRITRVDYRPGEGIFWDALYRWAPAAVQRGSGISLAQGLSALISRYLDAVVAAEEVEIEAFFAHLAARSRVRETLHALLAARELSFVAVGRKAVVWNTPAPEPRPEPRRRMAARPAGGRR